MSRNDARGNTPDRTWQALELWLVFIAILIVVNGTIPFVLGVDMHVWTYSKAKSFILVPAMYSGLFLVAPMILLRGWSVVRRVAFIAPLVIGTLGIFLWPFFSFAAALVVPVLAYLHRRFDLSDVGIRSRGWKGDALAIFLVGGLNLLFVLAQSTSLSFSFSKGVYAGLARLFANPASTVENLFYFGFMTEQLSRKTGKWLTPPLIAAMYTFHEMTNPEYWYEGVSFGFIFVGIAIFAAVYLWRRSAVTIWLTDGFIRFIDNVI